MDLLFFVKTLFFKPQDISQTMGKNTTKNKLSIRGESGEVILPLVFTLITGSFLFGSLFWLNKTYEQKTMEHLSEFRTKWNKLEEKYKN